MALDVPGHLGCSTALFLMPRYDQGPWMGWVKGRTGPAVGKLRVPVDEPVQCCPPWPRAEPARCGDCPVDSCLLTGPLISNVVIPQNPLEIATTLQRVVKKVGRCQGFSHGRFGLTCLRPWLLARSGLWCLSRRSWLSRHRVVSLRTVSFRSVGIRRVAGGWCESANHSWFSLRRLLGLPAQFEL